MGRCLVITMNIQPSPSELGEAVNKLLKDTSLEDNYGRASDFNEEEIHESIVNVSARIINDFIKDLEEKIRKEDIRVLGYERFKEFVRLLKYSERRTIVFEYPEKNLTPLQQAVAGAFIAETTRRSNKSVIVITSSKYLAYGASAYGATVYYLHRSRSNEVRLEKRPQAAFVLASHLVFELTYMRRRSSSS